MSRGRLVGISVRSLLEQSIEEDLQMHLSGQAKLRLSSPRKNTERTRLVIVIVTSYSSHWIIITLRISEFDKSLSTLVTIKIFSSLKYFHLNYFCGLCSLRRVVGRHHPSLSATERQLRDSRARHGEWEPGRAATNDRFYYNSEMWAEEGEDVFVFFWNILDKLWLQLGSFSY